MNVIALPGLAEPVAALSHLFAAALALAAAARLLRQVWGTGGGRVLAYGIFAGSAVALLGISGLYHALPLGSAARAFMQRMDHAAIFLLIAGSFTPLLLDNFHGLERALLTIVVWVCALSGVALKVFFFHAIPQSAGLAMYLGLGGSVWSLEGSRRGVLASSSSCPFYTGACSIPWGRSAIF